MPYTAAPWASLDNFEFPKLSYFSKLSILTVFAAEFFASVESTSIKDCDL